MTFDKLNDCMSNLPKILIVDDEVSTLDALERILRKNFEALRASSGEAALELLKHNQDIAIVISDFRMPKMDGIEFLTKARELAPNSTRAILSGQIDLTEMMQAVNSAQIHRFILKPWDNDYLLVQMMEALQNHQLLAQRNYLERLSITDPVTQLTNHRYFQEMIRKELERASRHQRPLGFIMIDVDHFKSFNDHYGHPEGDRLLANIAKRISNEVRGIDIVSRYGGEEFTVIMPDTSLEAARLVAERIRQSLESNPFAGPFGRSAFVTLSLGVACYPQHGEDAPTLISAADRALYQAKRQGRNQTVVAQQ
jgi:diguanylate cyclase (GGDEF)-like protein